MTPKQQERAKVLLKATFDILYQCEKTPYVENVMEVTANYDETECDGNCLKDDIEYLLDEINN